MYYFMNLLSLSCRSHSTDSSLVSSKNFDPVGRGEEAGERRGSGRKGGGGDGKGKEAVFCFRCRV